MKLFYKNILVVIVLIFPIYGHSMLPFQPSQEKVEKSYDSKKELKKVRSIKWQKEKVRKGVSVKKANVELFNSKQAIFLLEIDTARAKLNYFAGMPEFLEPVSVQAQEEDALFAINGSYFNMKEGPSIHFVKIDNKVAANTKVSEFKTRATGVVTITDNQVDIEDWNMNDEYAEADDADYAVVCGPIVIDDKETMDMWDSDFVNKRHPRSFIGFSKGKLILGVVDGRDPGRAEGMNLHELHTLARGLRCSDLLNLDGGGSSTLYVKGYSNDGIVNVPSDGHERPVKSIIYIKSR